MSLELMIYLAEVSGTLKEGLIFISILLIAMFLIFFPIILTEFKSELLKNKRFIIKSAIALIIIALAGALLPSEKTIYSIAAIKMGKELSKNENVIETYDKVYKLLNQKLDELIEKKEK